MIGSMLDQLQSGGGRASLGVGGGGWRGAHTITFYKVRAKILWGLWREFRDPHWSVYGF